MEGTAHYPFRLIAQDHRRAQDQRMARREARRRRHDRVSPGLRPRLRHAGREDCRRGGPVAPQRKNIPGHSLHEKRLQRQIGVGTLVSSQERIAFAVPLISRLSTAGQPRVNR